MVKGCALSTGYLPRGGLPRNSVDRITDRPEITSAVDRGRKASTQTNKQTNKNVYIHKFEVPIIWHTLNKFQFPYFELYNVLTWFFIKSKRLVRMYEAVRLMSDNEFPV